jgi:hypothetical protein
VILSVSASLIAGITDVSNCVWPFVVSFQIRKYESSNIFFLCKIVWAIKVSTD